MSDLIDRADAMGIVTKHYRAHDNDLLELIAYELEQLPSAEPDSKESSSTHKALDTISRQAAIDLCDWYDNPSMHDDLEKLPSAEPEQRWIPCSDCERRCKKWEHSKTLQE